MNLSAAEQLAQADQAEFFSVMSGEDLLGVVIKATIFIENQLIRLIEENIYDANQLKPLEPIPYDQRVLMAAAIGLRSTLVKPLKALGAIRNKFAHRLDAAITDIDAKNFYNAFVSSDQQVLQQIYQNLQRKADPPWPKRFHDLEPKDRFVFCAITLRGALISARAQAKDPFSELYAERRAFQPSPPSGKRD